MLRNKLYYGIKPWVPPSVRLAVRRWFARHKRAGTTGVWPVLPGSERQPQGWNGWPEGKKFAFVLTHDVESQIGLDRVRELMDLEMRLGFRSSFNLIPEGSYRVPAELRAEIVRKGFEVGVHDLHHDGKLYRRRQEFAWKARRINQYLKEWDAVGFRSGFMLHNLVWLGDLNVSYDSSTFDTDPFEPQPGGVRTIFPFWVSRIGDSQTVTQPDAVRNHGQRGSDDGYVELPYTLPQDSTLFLVLGERHPDIWMQKLEWVAKHGGMALLGAHPDYMNFSGKLRESAEFPVAFYQRFLEHVRERYSGQYWHVTPRELAQWYRSTRPRLADTREAASPEGGSLRGKRSAVVLYSYYPSDARPRREAEALVRAGMEVELICLREHPNEPKQENLNGVTVTRVPLQRRRDGKLTYIMQYASFILLSMFVLASRSLRRRYDLVHVHNMPDVLVFSGLFPRLRGARVMLDLHDPMPELMMSIFELSEKSWVVKILKSLEKWSIRFADQVITVNLACKKIFSSRSCKPEKILVVMNSPDEEIFSFRPFEQLPALDRSGRFVIMYHGSIVERHGLDLAVQALRSIKQSIPGAELRIYGTKTRFLDVVLGSVESNGLRESVRYFGPQTHEQIAAAIQECDVGIIPNRRSRFTEINTPTRIFEYLSRGKPVIAPQVPGITDYFGQQDLVFFNLGDAEDLARKLEYVHRSAPEVAQSIQRGQQVYLDHTWTQEKSRFLGRVRDLMGEGVG